MDYITIKLSQKGKKNAGLYVTVIDTVDEELAKVGWSVRVNKHDKYAFRYDYTNGRKNKKVQHLHREILSSVLERKLLPHEDVDHIDGDGLNNRRNNLRLATRSQNNMNRAVTSTSKTGFKGVVKTTKKTKPYRATMTYRKKQIHIGYFNTPEEADRAYRKKADEIQQDFAYRGEIDAN